MNNPWSAYLRHTLKCILLDSRTDYYESTGWNEDNLYVNLTCASRGRSAPILMIVQWASYINYQIGSYHVAR